MIDVLPDEPDEDELTIDEVSGGERSQQQVPSVTNEDSNAETSSEGSTVSSSTGTTKLHLLLHALISSLIHCFSVSSLEAEPSLDLKQEPKVYMVETDNFEQQAFETTDELKAVTQEVIKTIRDIIVSAPIRMCYITRFSSLSM